jgi:hypothetical protein
MKTLKITLPASRKEEWVELPKSLYISTNDTVMVRFSATVTEMEVETVYPPLESHDSDSEGDWEPLDYKMTELT